MGTERERSIFVACSISDPALEGVLPALMEQYDVITSTTVAGAAPLSVVIPGVVRGCGTALIVVPPVGDRERTRVIFEAGVAAGAGIPILVTSRGPSPGVLKGLPYIELRDPASMLRALRNLASIGVDPGWQSAAEPEFWLLSEDRQFTAETERLVSKNSFERMPESDLLAHVEAMLRSAGADVLAPRRADDKAVTDTADLVLWDDRLIAPFGMPLPIEILRDAGRLPALKARLRRTLKSTGARSLLAVAVKGSDVVVWPAYDGYILVVPLERLEQELEVRSLPRALLGLLDEARP